MRELLLGAVQSDSVHETALKTLVKRAIASQPSASDIVSGIAEATISNLDFWAQGLESPNELYPKSLIHTNVSELSAATLTI